MAPVTLFPHLLAAEFQTACALLVQTFESLHKDTTQRSSLERNASRKDIWSAVEAKQSYGEHYLRITKELRLRSETRPHPKSSHGEQRSHYMSNNDGVTKLEKDESDDEFLDESDLSEESLYEEDILAEPHDPESLHPSPSPPTPLIHYDILLSPTYRVPALYIHISDPQLRFPPTMNTLEKHLIAPAYAEQTSGVGVLGGITICDHPIEDRPVFFVHPCQTAEVMRAIVGGREVNAFEYLLMFLGAMGKCVGLDVPMELAARGEDIQVLR